MQNEKNLQQLIREYESNMPPEIMDVIKNFDWKRELRTIVMQNQLMVDVGSDLEESVYLMLLGVVKVEDVFERLIDVHELSEDRAKKVLEEIEFKIFNVLHKKLAEIDEKEEKEESIVMRAQSLGNTTQTKTNPGVEDHEDRDIILAEIEKDETEIVPKLETLQPSNTESSPKENPLAKISYQKPIEDSLNNTVPKPVTSSGVSKPFSLDTQKTTMDMITNTPEKVEGIQEDPISSGLNKATIVKPENTQSKSVVAPRATGAPDPYREPIE